MIFKAKLRKIGSTQGIYIPTDVITQSGFKVGDVITLYTKENETISDSETPGVKTELQRSNHLDFCKKHKWVTKSTCGCE
jgi:antitoxin component of MazEF toxin-antitoxin module